MPEDPKSNLKQHNAKTPRNQSFLHVKFNTFQLQSVPDLKGFYHSEFRERVDEIESHSTNLIDSAGKLFKKMISQNKNYQKTGAGARKNGYEIASVQPTQKNLDLVMKLEGDPYICAARSLLTSNVVNSGRDLDLNIRRRIIMQMAVPIGIGDFNLPSIKMLMSTFRNYQQKLLQQYREDKAKVRAQVNKETDYSKKMNLQKVGKILQTNEILLSRFLERRDAPTEEKEFLHSVSRKKFVKTLDGSVDVPKGKTLVDVQVDLEKNLAALIIFLLELRFLHPELLRLTKKMASLNPGSPLPAYLQGRIWMHQLKMAVIQEETTQKAKPLVQNRLQKCLQAYGTALKEMENVTNMSSLHLQIYLGHATACLFAYSLKSLLNIPPPVIKKILTTGKYSLEKSQFRVSNDTTGIHKRYIEALSKENLA